LTPAPTVAEQNRAEGYKPEHGFVEPSRPSGRRTFTVCYALVFAKMLLKYFKYKKYKSSIVSIYKFQKRNTLSILKLQ
jgi:hypothetical protein